MSEWNEADHHAERAQQFYRAGEWERALEALREALDRRPDEGEWLFGLGLTLDALHRYEEAAEAFEKALQHRGEDVPGLLHLGIDLLRAGKLSQAVDVLDRVNRLDAGVELGYVHRVLAYCLLDDHEQAEVMFYLARQVAEHHPDDSDPAAQAMAYDHLAQSLLLRGEHERAVWCWGEALRLDADHPDAHRSLAMIHERLGQTNRALQHLKQQLRSQPDDLDSLLDMGELQLRHGGWAEAGNCFRRALELDGTLAFAHQRLGDLSLKAGHLTAAADRYDRARQLDPGLPGVHLGLAHAAREQGRDDEATHWLTEELEREGQTAEQVLELASMLVELGMNHEAVRLLNPLLSGADDLLMGDNERYATALLCRGVALVADGDLDEGIRDCERCLRLLPDHPTALLQIAAATYSAGDLEAAEHWVREGLAAESADPELRRLRRRLRAARFVGWLRRRARPS
ncbi:MAG: tetratricopeptide repeat protein [Planctomycetota bacterium]